MRSIPGIHRRDYVRYNRGLSTLVVFDDRPAWRIIGGRGLLRAVGGVAFGVRSGVLVDAGGGVDHRSLTSARRSPSMVSNRPSAGPSTRLHRAARGMIATRIVETASQTIDVLE